MSSRQCCIQLDTAQSLQFLRRPSWRPFKMRLDDILLFSVVFTLLQLANALSYTKKTLPNVTVPPLYRSASGGNGSDACYASWLTYWSSSRASEQQLNVTLVPTFTLRQDQTVTIATLSFHTTTIMETDQQTVTQVDGGFTIGTETVESTHTETATIDSQSGMSTVYTNTLILDSTSWLGTMFPKPSCSLPSVVPSCQSQWESWASTQLMPAPTPPPSCDLYGAYGRSDTIYECATSFQDIQQSYITTVGSYPPVCQVASVGGDLCESVRDYYVGNPGYFAPQGFKSPFQNPLGGELLLPGFLGNASQTWPTSSTLAVPSCTMGCGRCAVTGGTVQLLYWPATSTSTGNLSVPVPTSAKAVGTSPITLVTLGTTLTSPTIYVSYKNVYASDGCTGIGSTLSNTILAIPTSSQLSSVYAYTPPCRGAQNNTFVQTNTAPFTVADLNSPVPFSIYSSQPWCASYEEQHGCHAGCPTTEAYKPILVLPNNVLQSMDPAWSTCYGDIRGFYDPPLALQPVALVAGVTTTTDASMTQAATPASSPNQPAAQTSQPANPTGLQTASASESETGAQPTSNPDHPSSKGPNLSGQYPTTFSYSAPASKSLSSATALPGEEVDPLSSSGASNQDVQETSQAHAPPISATLTAFVSALKPSNALQVLTAAESSDASNPTVAAILSTIGGLGSPTDGSSSTTVAYNGNDGPSAGTETTSDGDSPPSNLGNIVTSQIVIDSQTLSLVILTATGASKSAPIVLQPQSSGALASIGAQLSQAIGSGVVVIGTGTDARTFTPKSATAPFATLSDPDGGSTALASSAENVVLENAETTLTLQLEAPEATGTSQLPSVLLTQLSGLPSLVLTTPGSSGATARSSGSVSSSTARQSSSLASAATSVDGSIWSLFALALTTTLISGIWM